MPKTHTELYYHLVWSTWNRQPFLKSEIQENLYRYIAHKCEEYGYQIYAVNGMEDHIHVVVRLKPTITVAEAVGKIKGSAARFCNQTLDLNTVFKWQQGYGALTFGKRDLSNVVSYVVHQKTHHREKRLNSAFESRDNASM